MPKGYSKTPEKSYKQRSEALKGHFVSDETKNKQSLKKKGIPLSKEHVLKLKGRIPWNKGKNGLQHNTEEQKRKTSERMKGNKHTLGKTYPLEIRKKFGRRKEKHNGWKGGLSSLNEQIRKSIEYRLWREAVLKRDNWTCIWCFKKGGKIEADHIQEFAKYPELRFAIDNGRTLCKPCHIKRHKNNINIE